MQLGILVDANGASELAIAEHKIVKSEKVDE